MPIRHELRIALAEAKATGRHGYQVAAAAHIDPTTLSRIVTGQRVPHRLTAEAIARALDRDVADVFPDLAHPAERGCAA
jgi:transcriptional regulator with XRE-family HTH domain